MSTTSSLSTSKRNSIQCFVSNTKTFASNHKKGLIITAIAIGTLALLGAGLLAYMHFGGLGINAAGFSALGSQIAGLGHQISVLLSKIHKLSTAPMLYTVLIPTLLGSAILITGLACKRKTANNEPEIQTTNQGNVQATSKSDSPNLELGWDMEDPDGGL